MAARRLSGAMAALAACFALFIVSSAANTTAAGKLREEVSRMILRYTHDWPEMKFGWRIVLGTIAAFFGAGFGSVGGGAAGTFIPMLTIIVGFDTKSAVAISKCMITGVALSTLYFNIKRRHPTLDMPVIDYDLMLLFQPMLVFGISIGVTLNVVLPAWAVTLLFVIICLVTSLVAFRKGIIKWGQESTKKELDMIAVVDESLEQSLLNDPAIPTKVSLIQNVDWKKLGIIVSVWVAILVLQIIKSFTTEWSTIYWILNALQIPVAVAGSGYEAVMLYQGKAVIASRGEDGTHFKVRNLLFYCFVGVLAGTMGGTVGLGGGILLGPVFLEMGVPPQVSSATAIFAVLFSASMSSVEYYLLHRFPLPYTLYFVAISVVAAFLGQQVVKWLIGKLGRESPIIFIIAFTLFISAVFIGGEGIYDMIAKTSLTSTWELESLW